MSIGGNYSTFSVHTFCDHNFMRICQHIHTPVPIHPLFTYDIHLKSSFIFCRLKIDPPKVESQEALSQWLCRMHNKVNVKLGKEIFDCKKINERWRDGWLDGSCDQ